MKAKELGGQSQGFTIPLVVSGEYPPLPNFFLNLRSVVHSSIGTANGSLVKLTGRTGELCASALVIAEKRSVHKARTGMES